MSAAYNVLVDWNGIQADENSFVHLSMAEFGL